MKKLMIIPALTAVLFSSCKTAQLASNNDDVYANPADDLRLAKIAAQEKAKRDADAQAAQQQALLAQQAKDNANPAYQDPKTDPDDYYDYKYASRINRFDNPVPGAGYYDSRYTNYYTYNQNPSMYGSSIYSSYNWMPSNQFNGYSSGLSMGMGYGSGMGMGYGMGYGSSMMMGYGSGYGYNSGFYGGLGYSSFNNPMYYDPFNSFGYGYGGYGGYGYMNPYYSGYYNGYGSGLYGGYGSGWGYYNSFDVNSGYSQYAPRSSNGGGNSTRNTTAGMAVQSESARTGYFQSVAQQQQNAPRFSETNTARSAARPGNINNGNNGNVSQQMNSQRNANSPRNIMNNNTGSNPNISESAGTRGSQESGSPRGRVATETSVNSNNNNQPMNNGRSMNQNSGWNSNSNSGWNSGGGGSRSSGGGGGGGFSSPRSSGGGGGGRR